MDGENCATIARLYTPGVTLQLGRFAGPERAFLEAWLAEHAVGTNYALQILSLLQDLSRKERGELQALLREASAGIDGRDLQAKEWGRRVRDALRRRLHPHSGSHEEAFRDFVGQLGLKPEVELIPPQNFEGRCFSLKIDFDSVEGLRASLEAIQSNLATRDWSKLKGF